MLWQSNSLKAFSSDKVPTPHCTAWLERCDLNKFNECWNPLMSGTWPGPDGGLGIRSSITFNKSWTTSWKGHVWQSSKTIEEESWVWKMAFLQPSRNSSKGQGDTRIEALFHVNQSLWQKPIHRLIWFSGLHFALPAAAVILKQDYMGDLFQDKVSCLLRQHLNCHASQ